MNSSFYYVKGNTRNTSESREKLRAAYVPVVKQSLCSHQYQMKGKIITNSMICAGYKEGGRDACQGDSGEMKLMI